MQTSDNEPNNQTDNTDIISDDSDNIPNMDDISSFATYYKAFIIIGFITSILNGYALLIFSICSLIFAFRYNNFCTKNISKCSNRIDHIVH